MHPQPASGCGLVSEDRRGCRSPLAQTRKGVLLLQMAPYQPESGEIYIYDRLRDMWYLLSFESPFDGFSVDSFEKVYKEYKLLAYVEQPGLLQHLVERGMESVSVPAPVGVAPVAPDDLAYDLEMAALIEAVNAGDQLAA